MHTIKQKLQRKHLAHFTLIVLILILLLIVCCAAFLCFAKKQPSFPLYPQALTILKNANGPQRVTLSQYGFAFDIPAGFYISDSNSSSSIASTAFPENVNIVSVDEDNNPTITVKVAPRPHFPTINDYFPHILDTLYVPGMELRQNTSLLPNDFHENYHAYSVIYKTPTYETLRYYVVSIQREIQYDDKTSHSVGIDFICDAEARGSSVCKERLKQVLATLTFQQPIPMHLFQLPVITKVDQSTNKVTFAPYNMFFLMPNFLQVYSAHANAITLRSSDYAVDKESGMVLKGLEFTITVNNVWGGFLYEHTVSKHDEEEIKSQIDDSLLPANDILMPDNTKIYATHGNMWRAEIKVDDKAYRSTVNTRSKARGVTITCYDVMVQRCNDIMNQVLQTLTFQ